MVKFGEAIAGRLVDGWEHAYVPYNSLKKQIKKVAQNKEQGNLTKAQSQTDAFFEDLQKSVHDCDHFFMEQVDKEWGGEVDETSKRVFDTWKRLSEGGEVDDDAKNTLTSLSAKLARISCIDQFSLLNREAVRKIVKKFDKKTRDNTAQHVASEMKRRKPFQDERLDKLRSSYQGLSQLIKALGGIAEKCLETSVDIEHEKLPSPYEVVPKETKPAVKRWKRFINLRVLSGLLLILSGIYATIVAVGIKPSLIEALVFVAVPVAFLMAAANGANDIANSMGTSVGAGALTMRQALGIACVFEVAGALSMGGEVSKTISKGVLNSDAYKDDAGLFAWGMLCVLIGSTVTTLIATVYGYPISATHSIIASVVAVGLASKGTSTINNEGIGNTCIGWVASPLAGMFVSCLLHTGTTFFVLHAKNKKRRALQARPVYVTLTIAIALMLILIKGPPDVRVKPVYAAVLVSIGIGMVFAVFDYTFRALQRRKRQKVGVDSESVEDGDVDVDAEASSKDSDPMVTVSTDTRQGKNRFSLDSLTPRASSSVEETDDAEELINEEHDLDIKLHTQETDEERVEREAKLKALEAAEKTFVPLLILSAISVAFAHGANDLGNAVGPLAAVWEVYQEGEIQEKPNIDWWQVGLGSAGFVVGIILLGNRTIDTVGNKLSSLTPSKAFGTQIGAAVVVLASSALGLPVSTSHILIGCVVGVGFAEKICGEGGKINGKVLLKIIAAWGLTIPLAMAAATIVFFMANTRYDNNNSTNTSVYNNSTNTSV